MSYIFHLYVERIRFLANTISVRFLLFTQMSLSPSLRVFAFVSAANGNREYVLYIEIEKEEKRKHTSREINIGKLAQLSFGRIFIALLHMFVHNYFLTLFLCVLCAGALLRRALFFFFSFFIYFVRWTF